MTRATAAKGACLSFTTPTSMLPSLVLVSSMITFPAVFRVSWIWLLAFSCGLMVSIVLPTASRIFTDAL